MTRRWLAVTALLLFGTALVAIGVRLANHSKPEPTFSGRTVTQWLKSADYETNRAAVTVAVLVLGKASVPELRRMLHSGNKLERVWFAKAPRWLYRRLPLGGSQFDRKDRAMWALKTLGRVGQQATPDLLAILEDSTEHWNQRYGAVTTLRAIEAEPSVRLPVLDRLIGDPVVGKLAASEAQSLRAAAERQRLRELEKSLAASLSAREGTPKAGFPPSGSFSEHVSL